MEYNAFKEKLALVSLLSLSFTGVSIINIGKAPLTPFHVIMGALIGFGIFFAKKSRNTVMISLMALGCYVLVINFIMFPNIRITSVVYTMIYIMEAIVLYNLMKHCQPKNLILLMKWIIYLYVANVGIGFVFSTVGIRLGFLEQIIRVYYTDTGEARPMGFSTEPSYSAFIISASFLCFNHLRNYKVDQDTIKLCFLYLLGIVMMKSSYGFIFVAVVAMDAFWEFQKRVTLNLKMFIFGLGFFFVIVGGYSISLVENKSIERVTDVIAILANPYDDIEKKMIKFQAKDGSAFARIGPTYILFSSDEIDQSILVFGAGGGVAGEFFAKLLTGILVDEGAEKLDMGIIPAFLYDYGIIGVSLLFSFIIICLYNLPFPFWLSIILVLPNANINTQLLWFGLMAYLALSMVKAERKVYPKKDVLFN